MWGHVRNWVQRSWLLPFMDWWSYPLDSLVLYRATNQRLQFPISELIIAKLLVETKSLSYFKKNLLCKVPKRIWNQNLKKIFKHFTLTTEVYKKWSKTTSYKYVSNWITLSHYEIHQTPSDTFQTLFLWSRHDPDTM